MYNRILKRPMFKRGGSSFQAQGTGITSPYDTPRKNYKVGTTWEEINERRSGLYQPRGEMSFAAEGFSELGNPYKDDGSAKTIGEMLYAGARGVRKSRAADKALGQSVDLANIESDAARLMAEEKHARDLELVAASAKSQLNKDFSINRQISDRTAEIIKIASGNPQNPGAEFELSGAAQGIAMGEVTITSLQTGDEIKPAMVIPSSAFKKTDQGWDYDIAQLAAGMVYWDPMKMKWLIVENAQTAKANPVYFNSYEEAAGGLKVKKSIENEEKSIVSDPDSSPSEIKNNEIKMKIVTNLKDVDINDKSVIYDEAAKIGIKIVENPGGSKTWLKDLADNEMTIFAFKEILKKKKMNDTYGHISSKKGKRGEKVTEEIKLTEKMASGGRAGYAAGSIEPDPDADEMNELAAWWKSEVNKSFDS